MHISLPYTRQAPDPIIKHLTLSIAFSVDIDNSFLLIYNTISRNGLQSYLKNGLSNFFTPYPVFSFPKPMKTCNLSQKHKQSSDFSFNSLFHSKFFTTFASAFRDVAQPGRVHVWGRVVAGSNPVIPTESGLINWKTVY